MKAVRILKLSRGSANDYLFMFPDEFGTKETIAGLAHQFKHQFKHMYQKRVKDCLGGCGIRSCLKKGWSPQR